MAASEPGTTNRRRRAGCRGSRRVSEGFLGSDGPTPGGVFAVGVWVLASGVFALYVADFSSYNKTYGALAGIIIFLVWLWISNIAVLLGAELNAELQRARMIEARHSADREPFVEPRAAPKGARGEALMLGGMPPRREARPRAIGPALIVSGLSPPFLAPKATPRPCPGGGPRRRPLVTWR